MYSFVPSDLQGDAGSVPFRGSDLTSDESRRILTLAIEQGLSVLGESVAGVVFSNLYKRFSLAKHEVLEEPDRFLDALKEMFGSGAGTVEMLIVKSLCETINVDPNSLNPFTLSHALSLAKHKLKIMTEKGKTKSQPVFCAKPHHSILTHL